MPTLTTFGGNSGVYSKNSLYKLSSTGLVLNLDASNSNSYLSSGTTWTDFFASRSTDYSKAGQDENWDEDDIF